MRPLTITVEGLSEEKIREDIKRMTNGFRLFFHEPEDAEYTFLNSFWGIEWKNYDSQELRKIILAKTSNGDRTFKHFLLEFVLNGTPKYVFCSWTRQLYALKTKQYYEIAAPLADGMTDKIKSLEKEEAERTFKGSILPSAVLL